MKNKDLKKIFEGIYSHESYQKVPIPRLHTLLFCKISVVILRQKNLRILHNETGREL